MKKRKPKKEFLKTFRKYHHITELQDKATAVSHHMAVPVLGRDLTPDSRVLVPVTATMPVIPIDPLAQLELPPPMKPGIGNIGTPQDHNAQLVELARTVVPTEKERTVAKKAKFRSDQLEKIDQILSGRRSNHGDPEDNFAKIAEAWNLWRRWKGLPGDISYSDVPVFMSLLKLAREASGHGDSDNALDAASYLLIYNELRHPHED